MAQKYSVDSLYIMICIEMSLSCKLQIGNGEKLINVVLLNGERLNVRVPTGATGQDLYNTISEHLGLAETIFFGLMIIKDGEHEFLDLNDKLSKLAKYAPHLWKDDVSCNSSLVFTIFFRVKYYVENICLLQQQGTRYFYFPGF
ncbi:FERM and PDZ domain-containing protein 2, partial [Exaiptasia diaphana]|uniref:FERM domain-containing protein n=2 Tax=Exaiptasia diaphana TaxID=2652724 RepID=A0A913XH48_EXADI